MTKSDKLLMGYRLNEPEVDVMHQVTMQYAAMAVDMQEKTIVEAVIKAAKEQGITQLYLLDRDFVVAAIREKLEKDGSESLHNPECLPTIDAVEVVRCKECEQGSPCMVSHRVWCEEFDRPVAMDGYCHFGVRKEVVHETD